MKRADLKKWFDSEEFEREYHTDEALGARCGVQGTVFTLWAPTASKVRLFLYEDGAQGGAYKTVAMKKAERGVWRYETKENLDGVYYDYEVTAQRATRRAADPYARACGMNGMRSMVIDLARTNPAGWENDRAPARKAEDVIYEIHVKDFSWDPAGGAAENERGKYKALTRLDTTLCGDGMRPTLMNYVKKLGVTHVQLMPVYDYGSVDEGGDPDAFNWGYDPVNYNIPEGSYSSDPAHGEVRIRELKEAIAAMHAAGLRVIMDVVYNHTYHLDSHLFSVVPWYYHRQKKDGTAANGSGCGCELASERSMCGKYILDSVLYWAEEYHIDGFRFDLMGLHDTELMNGIQAALNARFGSGEKLIYGEPWAGGASNPREGTMLCDKDHIKELREEIGAFCDMTRDAVKGGLASPQTPGFVNGGAFSASHLACCVKGWAGGEPGMIYRAPSQTITYLSAHDDWTLWDKLIYSMAGGKNFEARCPQVLRANKLAAAMLVCCQGHLFMLSGEEFGRTKLGEKNSYASPVQLNRMDWRRAWDNCDLVDYYRGLIALRMQLPGLCDKSALAGARVERAIEPCAGTAALQVNNEGAGSAYKTLLLAFNAAKEDKEIDLPDGEWTILADGESSWLWEAGMTAKGRAKIASVSALILGKK